MGLNEAEVLRYARHIILGEVGGRGQLRLRRGGVLLLGLGGVGCGAAAYLIAAGVGRLGLADPRPVGTAANSGAILLAGAAAASPRAAAAAGPLQALNPHGQVEVLADWPEPAAAAQAGWDLVIASAGDWAAWAGAATVPLLLAGAAGDYGALAWLTPGPAAAAQLVALQAAGLAPEADAVLAPVAGAVGAAAATEAIKRILGIGTPLVGMLAYDGAAAGFASL